MSLLDNKGLFHVSAKSRAALYHFITVFALTAVLSYLVAQPLLRPLAWSTLLSFFAYPLFRLLKDRLFRGRFPIIAAALTTAAIVLLLVIPALFVGLSIAREGIRLYGYLADHFLRLGTNPLVNLEALLPEGWVARLNPLLEQLSFLSGTLRQAATWLGSSLATASRGFLENAFRLGYQLIVIAVASFFLLKDGHLILQFVKDITPLSSDQRDAFFGRIRRMMVAMIYGVTLTAGLQAALGIAGWLFVGLPNPAIFGLMMFILAMIPFVGTPLVWGPAALYLILAGQVRDGIILLIWGIVVVSTIDNLIRPIFISEGSKVHILIVFTGVVGGLSAWGFLGLFLGPIILTMFVFLLDTYRLAWRDAREG